jgi:hypothetical protein
MADKTMQSPIFWGKDFRINQSCVFIGRNTNENTKHKIYILYSYYYFTIGNDWIFFLGLKLDYFGNSSRNYPTYKSYIFNSYVAIILIYTTFYAIFCIKYDEEISKKRKKK